MKKLLSFFVVVLLAMGFSSCEKDNDPSPNPSPKTDFPTNEMVDASVNPGNDFYSYCNGTWVKSHPLSGKQQSRMYWVDDAYAGNAFKEILISSNDPVIHKLMADAAKTPSSQQLTELKQKTNEQLARIDALQTLDEVIREVGVMGMHGYNTGVQLYLYPVEGAVRMALDIAMPSVASAEHWQKVTGCTEAYAKQQAGRCDSIEKIWEGRIGVLPRQTAYTTDVRGRELLARAAGIETSKLVYGDYDYDNFMTSTVTDAEIACWKQLLRQAIVAYNYRWTFCSQQDLADYLYNGCHPFTYRISRVYSQTYQSMIMRDFIQQMVEEIREAFIETLEENKWLSAATKRAAIEKAQEVASYCGYPNVWLEDRMIEVPTGTNLLQDMEQACEEWNSIVRAAVKENPSEDDVWYCLTQMPVTPYNMNACYLPDANMLFMFMPMMLPNVCRQNVPDSYNYGMVGVIAGHEFGHGFDSNGCLHGKKGEWANWWSADDKANFDARIKALADLNSSYQPLPETHPELYCNGVQTSGEDVADLSGCNTALRAMISHYRKKGASEADILKAEQEFFLAYGNTWAGSFSENYIVNRVKTNVHSVPQLRINGVVRHMDEWYRVYNIKPTDQLYLAPEKRVKIWNN